ncbi:hypothetical protein HPB47_025706 [Ixodes persulcatus]|uniref:Uncharacterized protein n=1 Tax=Ixodes persulcatus TaxID=34615 RepID=A0AC60Q0V6_IXOPE|nr:hypothetical protein HPB47_025706 [Ixodes persulcatus]
MAAGDFSSLLGVNFNADATAGIGDMFLFKEGKCPRWLPPNHLLFHLANASLLLSYVAPEGIYGLLYLRFCIAVGSLFFAMWGCLVLCSVDTLVWNALFTLINLAHLCVLAYTFRPVRFKPDLEVVYKELFQPLKVTRHQFQKVADCAMEALQLDARGDYSFEKVNPTDSLSLVLSGRLLAYRNGCVLLVIGKLEFLDSPRWFYSSGGDLGQVTTTALEKCKVILWNREELKLAVSKDTYLKSVFDNVVASDVVRKLRFVTEKGYQGMARDLDNYSETTALWSKAGH